jgi:hypothetical protein
MFFISIKLLNLIYFGMFLSIVKRFDLVVLLKIDLITTNSFNKVLFHDMEASSKLLGKNFQGGYLLGN